MLSSPFKIAIALLIKLSCGSQTQSSSRSRIYFPLDSLNQKRLRFHASPLLSVLKNTLSNSGLLLTQASISSFGPSWKNNTSCRNSCPYLSRNKASESHVLLSKSNRLYEKMPIETISSRPSSAPERFVKPSSDRRTSRRARFSFCMCPNSASPKSVRVPSRDGTHTRNSRAKKR